MRNILKAAIGMMLAVGGLVACTSPAQKGLNEGYQSLDAGQYDEALAQADEYLNKIPRGAGAAEAQYLKGRAFEQRTAANTQQMATNFQAAREAYVNALGLSPSSQLEAYIRTSLGKVAFFQEDYSTAAQQLVVAYEKLDQPGLKAAVLYHVGLCQQRMNRFPDADQNFYMVQKEYSTTVWSRLASEHQGIRNFYVQMAVFSTPSLADSSCAGLRRMGIFPSKLVDAKGRQVIRAGPYSSYGQARAVKTRVANVYPDAMILP